MNDKNKIKSEIERLLNKEWKWGSSIEAKFRCEAYRELLEFIDSLPKEDASEDLEKAAIYNQLRYIFDEKINETTLGELKYVGEGNFKDGAQWKKQQLIDKACEFFYHRILDVGDVEFSNIENFINDFKKYLEDK